MDTVMTEILEGLPLAAVSEEREMTPLMIAEGSRKTTRHWPYEKKRRVVEETMKPGMSVSIVARRHDINANLVFSWRKLYQEGRLGVKAGEQSFIPVGVVGGGSQSGVLTPAPVTAPRMAGLIELELPGGARLRFDNRVEEPALRRVLRAVKSCA
jgi:transposase